MKMNGKTINQSGSLAGGGTTIKLSKYDETETLWKAEVKDCFESIVGLHTISIEQAGDLAPDNPNEDGLPAVDNNKLKNIILFFSYTIKKEE